MNTIYLDPNTQRPVFVNTKITPPEGVPHMHTPDKVDPNDVYVSKGKLKIRPPRPDAVSRFDPETETWVRDPVSVAEQVRNNRQENYPPLADQLDMLWHAMATGQIPKAEPFFSEIEAVKARFPKPSN